MKNYEKYEEKIREYKGETFCADFIRPYILKQNGCGGMDCEQCNMIQMIWLMKEYEEPKVDWDKVEIDTPILVRDFVEDRWKARHFAKYKNRKVYAWSDGVTSWSTEGHVVMWNYAKLAGSEEE